MAKTTKTACPIEGCGRKSEGEGHCSTHYRKLRHEGKLGPRIPCLAQGCPYFSVKVSLCTNCYERAKRATPQKKAYEKKFRTEYMSRPEIAERTKVKKRERCRATGYYQSLEYKAHKKAYYTSEHGRALYKARTAARRAAKRQATPAWANSENLKEIYKGCPRGYHVDHIIPLISNLVCGLHVENNLQYLPATENIQKSNNFDFEEYKEQWLTTSVA